MSEENKKIQNEIFKPIFKTFGKGKVIWNDNSENKVEFRMQLNKNGITTGELEFLDIGDDYGKLWKCFKLKFFKINGVNEEQEKIVAEKCYITKIHEKQNDVISIKAEISIGKLEYPCKEISENSDGILIKFYVTNMFQTFRVILDTEVGRLTISHFSHKEELDHMMKDYHMPLISSVIDLEIPRNNIVTVQKTIDNAQIFIKKFLRLSSFAQLSWHSIIGITAYEIKNNELHSRIFFKIVRTKIKIPGFFGLTDKIGIMYFLESLLKGYSEPIDKKYGFSYALEWYIDSWNAENLETKFLCATTSLELLSEKFHSNNKTAIVIPNNTFKKFQKKIKPQIVEILNALDVDKEKQKLMYECINAMQRRPYVVKIKMLLEHLKIRYDDLGISIEELVKIRNEITHVGRLKEGEQPEMIKAFEGIFVLITRILLAISNFDFEYWDMVKKENVKFEDIKIK